MLEELNVRDFALIERLSIRFSSGLTLLTGETGAGKSLLIGAISFLLGAKVDTNAIRTGAEESMVSGMFDISKNPEALAWLSNKGFGSEEGRVLIRRSIKASGKGYVYIQNQQALRSDLSDFTSLLLDLHGQHAHQTLTAPENHRKLLDRYAQIEDEVAAYYQKYTALSTEKKTYLSALHSEADRAREIDFLRYTIREIKEANLQRGELADLQQEDKLLTQYEKLFESVANACKTLSGVGDEAGALSLLHRLRMYLDAGESIDSTLSDMSRRLDDVYYELEDISLTLSTYSQSLRFNPNRLQQVQARIAEIGKLRKKYGAATIEDILDRYEGDKQRLSRLESFEEDKETIEKRIAVMESEIHSLAMIISEKRKAAGMLLQEKIEATIKLLGMPNAHFLVQITKKGVTEKDAKPLIGPYGVDEVEFLIAPNIGESARPLARIASGGELSRVALAAKTALMDSDNISTLIFDEVDAGIGGSVALAVGEYLKTLSRTKQVLCVTHLASLAVRADNHYKVDKEIIGNKSITHIRLLDGQDRKEEIARMLAGEPRGKASLAHAEELLRKQREADIGKNNG